MGNAAALCSTGRKRRAINFMESVGDAPDIAVSPVDDSSDDLVEDGMDGMSVELESGESKANRDPRFLLYWMTTTSTSTSTTYTATTSVGTLICTPSGFTINQCG